MLEKGGQFPEDDRYKEEMGNVFSSDSSIMAKNQKSIYNTVKFTLMHGGKYLFTAEDIDLLEKSGIMNLRESVNFALVGEMYKKAQKEGKNLDEKTLEDLAKFEVGYRRLDRAQSYEKVKKVKEVLDHLDMSYGEGPFFDEKIDELSAFFAPQAYSMAKERKSDVYQLLSQGTPERNTKAEELKEVMRERDAKGSKKTLRAFLKEKTTKAPAKKSKEME